ncbi:uncharacterized protein YecE (DUF72 family) [Sphaerotilus hippei]|uniref:Uncharacterized protein YecE (DUF72 family) n=1 Tax=Sphaerotilus hippei TaxID=744406 RepID=A0A318H3S4_9BURK|nr:DUF72 domain-containing protein [Sphaerotilus hippei]PXW98217.1 uncharacterized protein YecE (DUF72 family) [Sphaerotilus hippei]
MPRPPPPPAAPVQDLLFDAPADPAPIVQAHDAGPELRTLARQLPPRVHLGTSSWSFPGWAGLVWAGRHADGTLARHGLAAYARHPLLRTVSLDRSFYRPMSAAQFAACAAQVPDDFRFIVKAPALVADAVLRSANGQGLQPNPGFLDPVLASEAFVSPALEGLGHRIGALVFEIPPLPADLRRDLPALFRRLARLLGALPALAPTAPDAVIAVEVRDPDWLVPDLRDVLRETGARYCLGLHPRLPPIAAQLPLLRALWPGPFVCRWSLNRRHGAQGYDAAKATYAPFDRLLDPDPDTREALARIIRGTAGAGFPVYVSVNNKAEGCAPRSVIELARAILGDLSA